MANIGYAGGMVDQSEERATIGEAQRRIVDHLKRGGGRTTADVAAALGVTTQAVRPQLADLEQRGLVVAETLTTGSRGRPPIGWALSPLAIDLFPDRHADLTVELLAALRTAVGDDGLAAVLAVRDDEHRRRLEERRVAAGVADDDVAGRVALLAEQRTRQGYMAEVRPDGDDLLLVEHHCPVCAAATECQRLCTNELELFRTAVGPAATVERSAHLLAGDERCVYRIRVRGGAA